MIFSNLKVIKKMNSEFKILNSEQIQRNTLTKITLLVTLTLIFAFPSIQAQSIDYALLFSQPNSYYTPRAGGLGVAFHGISDDFGALMYNPAGLSLVSKNEISFGLGFLRNSNETEFFNNKTDFSANSAYISQIGIVSPFKAGIGNGAFSIGYFRESNYNNDYKYSGFNDTTTYINYRTTTGPNSLNDNMGGYLELGKDTNGYMFTPIKKNLQQNAFVRESGGMHNITGGVGVELNDNISVGFAITGKWGNYEYIRDYTESDTKNLYNVYKSDFSNVDFDHLDLNENLEQSISGITGSIGLQARIANIMRLSASVKFPTYYDITADFSRTAQAYFDDNTHIDTAWYESGSTTYKVVSPWVYCGGISIHTAGLTVSAGIEYTDATQLEFRDATPTIMNLNSQIVQYLAAQTTIGLGAEYEIPLFPMVVRASISSTSSPYTENIDGANLINLAFGAGVYIAPNIRLDGLFRWSKLSQLKTNFGSDPVNRFILTTTPINFGLQLTYRY
jgi:hypothetical protein